MEENATEQWPRSSLEMEAELPPYSSAVLTNDALQDVEDYVPENEPEDLSGDTFHHVFDFVQDGNVAFRENRVVKAISFYSKANCIKSGDPIILSNRSAAYIRISLYLKHRSPSESDKKPVIGLDATTLAELGLKDAEKLVDLRSNSVKSYLLKANALFLLEKYEKARDVILSGLQVDSFSDSLWGSLEHLESASASSIRMSTRGQPERNDDFDCTVCLKLLYEPVTTPCGHSFCRSCLLRSMDGGNKCPLCRTVLFITPTMCFISVTLKNIIQKSFPEEYAERKQEQDNLTNLGVDLLPLFVFTVVVPCQKFALPIYEPRYKLMVRRIMEGNHRMGMVMSDYTTDSLGCEVEIIDWVPLPNGHYDIEIASRRRFRIIKCFNQDGYVVAEVEWIQDIMPSEGTREREHLQELTYNAARYARSWIRRAKEEAGQDERRRERIMNLEAMMPSLRDPERFSFWLATLSSLSRLEILNLLRITDTKQRIKLGLQYLREHEQGRRSKLNYQYHYYGG